MANSAEPTIKIRVFRDSPTELTVTIYGSTYLRTLGTDADPRWFHQPNGATVDEFTVKRLNELANVEEVG